MYSTRPSMAILLTVIIARRYTVLQQTADDRTACHIQEAYRLHCIVLPKAASFDDEFGKVDHSVAGVDVDGPVGDAECREDDRKDNTRVPVDRGGATHVRVLCRRRRRGRRGGLGLDDMLLGVHLHRHLQS